MAGKSKHCSRVEGKYKSSLAFVCFDGASHCTVLQDQHMAAACYKNWDQRQLSARTLFLQQQSVARTSTSLQTWQDANIFAIYVADDEGAAV